MQNQARRSRACGLAVAAALSVAVALAAGGALRAEEGRWTIRLEPVNVNTHGHDQHVMTIHRFDFDATPQLETNSGFAIDTDSEIGFRAEFRYARAKWDWGIDFFWLATSQSAPNQTDAADGAGGIDEVVYEVADRSFSSDDPGEVLFFNLLEDTDVASWTVDAFALRTLAETDDARIRLQFGLRVGDFDNDYRAVVGIEGDEGRRLDASSNYDLMMGPLVGLAAEVHRGKNRIDAYLGQSLILGNAELSSMARDFTGPYSETPAYFDQREFRLFQDAAVPVTEMRLRWTYGLTRRIGLGVGAYVSTWWDLQVPPGVVPMENGGEALHEATMIFFGMAAAVELNF